MYSKTLITSCVRNPLNFFINSSFVEVCADDEEKDNEDVYSNLVDSQIESLYYASLLEV